MWNCESRGMHTSATLSTSLWWHRADRLRAQSQPPGVPASPPAPQFPGLPLIPSQEPARSKASAFVHRPWGPSGTPQSEKKVKVLVIQSCPTLWDPMDCSLPGSSVLGTLQARVLGWVAIPFSRGSSQPRDHTQVSHFAGRLFTIRATRETSP